MKKLIAKLLVLTFCLSFASLALAADPLKVALVLPGKMDDVSWNQALAQGMKMVEKELAGKIKVTYVENVYEVSDIEPALRDFAAEGYDVIFGHGFQFMEPILRVAAAYPKTKFALGTGFKTLPNTCVYDVHLTEGGYIMGILAAGMTKTNKLGVIGGVDVSEIYRGHEGFKHGAKSVKPDIQIQELYTGDWRDAAKAKEGAMSMYDSGVDVIWHSGDGIGLGVVDAAKEKNKLVLGNVIDSNVLAPNNSLSSVHYHWEVVIKQIFADIMSGEFDKKQDKFYWLSVSNDGLKPAPFHGMDAQVSTATKAKLAAGIAGLKDGSIKMPDFNK